MAKENEYHQLGSDKTVNSKPIRVILHYVNAKDMVKDIQYLLIHMPTKGLTAYQTGRKTDHVLKPCILFIIIIMLVIAVHVFDLNSKCLV